LDRIRGDIPPSEWDQQVRGVIQRNVTTLSTAAAEHSDAEAHALRFSAQALALRASSALTGDVAVYGLQRQLLVLLGAAGTATRAHIDPVAALTRAEAVTKKSQQCDRNAALAVWLFISPAVWATPQLLRRLLWRVAQSAAAEDMLGSESRKAAAAAEAAAAETDEVAASPLTPQEQDWLAYLLSSSTLSEVEMEGVEAALGTEYAIVHKQKAGEVMRVPVGWMHWVVNLLPCIKCAWEVVRPQDIAAALQTQLFVRCRAPRPPGDYLKIITAVVHELLAWAGDV
jgi:hypothetical protein